MQTSLSLGDADAWGRIPEEFKRIVNARSVDGLNFSFFEMGAREDNPPVVAPLRLEPGYVLPRHAHDCYRCEIIIQGSLDIGDKILRAGDMMFSNPRVLYGPHVAGPEGCITIEIFSSLDASHTNLVEGEEGELVAYDTWTPEGASKMLEHASAARAPKAVPIDQGC